MLCPERATPLAPVSLPSNLPFASVEVCVVEAVRTQSSPALLCRPALRWAGGLRRINSYPRHPTTSILPAALVCGGHATPCRSMERLQLRDCPPFPPHTHTAHTRFKRANILVARVANSWGTAQCAAQPIFYVWLRSLRGRPTG